MKCSRADIDEVQQCRGSAVGQMKSSSAQARQRRNRLQIKKDRMDCTGTGERGLPLGTRGAAVYARDKVVLLRCLLLNPLSLVRYHDFGKLLECIFTRGALACSMIFGGLRGCSA